MKIDKKLLIYICTFIIFLSNAFSQEGIENFIYNNNYLFNEQNLIWIDNAYYTTEIFCINRSKENNNKLLLELFANNKVYKTSYTISPNKGFELLLSKLNDFKKVKGSVKFGTLKFWLPYEMQCNASYISKNNKIESNFSLEKKDMQVAKSYFLYKSNQSNYENIKAIRTYIYNTSDDVISGKVKRYNKNGKLVSNLDISIDKNKNGYKNFVTYKNMDMILEVELNNDAKFISYLEIEYNDGFKQIIKPNAFFDKSSLLEARGEGIFTNLSETPKEFIYQIYEKGKLKLEDTIKIPARNIKNLNIDKKVHILKIEDKLQNLSGTELGKLINNITSDFEVETNDLQDFIDYIWRQENSEDYNTFISAIGEYLNINDDESDYIIKFITKDDDAKILGHIENIIKNSDNFIKKISSIIRSEDKPLTIETNENNELLLYNNTEETFEYKLSYNDRNINVKINANDVERVKLNKLLYETNNNTVTFLDRFSLINRSYAQTDDWVISSCSPLVQAGVSAGEMTAAGISVIGAGAVSDVVAVPAGIYFIYCKGVIIYYYETDKLVDKLNCPSGYFPESCQNPSTCDYVVSYTSDGDEAKIYYRCVQKCSAENLAKGGKACGDGCCYEGTTCAYDPNSHIHRCSCKTIASWYPYLVGGVTGHLISNLPGGYTTDDVVEMVDPDTGMIMCCPLGSNIKNGKCEGCASGVVCEGECCDVGEGCVTDYVWSSESKKKVWMKTCGKCREHYHWNKIKGECVCDADYAWEVDPMYCGEVSCRQDEIYKEGWCACKNGNVRCPNVLGGNAKERGICCDDGQVCVEHNNSHICTSCNEYEEYDTENQECRCKINSSDLKHEGGFMCGSRCCLASQYCDVNEQCVTCKENEYFDENKKICVCKNESVCGTECCESNQYCDSTNNACAGCDVKCGDVCCKNGEYCNFDNVCASCDEDEYFLKSQNMCVCLSNDEPKCMGLCCPENMSCNTGNECECKAELKCGDECCQNGEYCNSENKCAQICDSSKPISCGTTCCSSNSICENGICMEISCPIGQHYVNTSYNIQNTTTLETSTEQSNDVSCGGCQCDIPCGKDGNDCCKSNEQCVVNSVGEKECVSCPSGQIYINGKCSLLPCDERRVRCGGVCCGENQFCNENNVCMDCEDGTRLNPNNNKCEDIKPKSDKCNCNGKCVEWNQTVMEGNSLKTVTTYTCCPFRNYYRRNPSAFAGPDGCVYMPYENDGDGESFNQKDYPFITEPPLAIFKDKCIPCSEINNEDNSNQNSEITPTVTPTVTPTNNKDDNIDCKKAKQEIGTCGELISCQGNSETFSTVNCSPCNSFSFSNIEEAANASYSDIISGSDNQPHVVRFRCEYNGRYCTLTYAISITDEYRGYSNGTKTLDCPGGHKGDFNEKDILCKSAVESDFSELVCDDFNNNNIETQGYGNDTAVTVSYGSNSGGNNNGNSTSSHSGYSEGASS